MRRLGGIGVPGPGGSGIKGIRGNGIRDEAEFGKRSLSRKRDFEVGSTADTVQRIQNTAEVVFNCGPTCGRQN